MAAHQKICRACGRVFRGVEVFCPEDGSRLQVAARSDPALSDPLVGTVLDSRYRVLRILGEGGMGIVYEAAHERIDRKVAIKVLREDFSRRPDVVERFRREAKSASRIGHPNIVDVLDFGQTPGGASYFVMEMLEGQDLADMLHRDARLSPSRAVGIAHQCCRALAAAHDKGIVHRDLKPENVFLIERGGFPDFVKLVDFGVAKMTELDAGDGAGGRKLTRTGMIFGTPEYMSPEQANGQPLDHRVDVYALGIILFETLTGNVPFEGETFMAVLSKHAAQPVPPLRQAWPGLALSPQLEQVVMTALEKAREQRFPDMRAFAEALEAVPEMPDTIPRDSHVPVRSSSSPGLASSPGALQASSVAQPSPQESSLSPAEIASLQSELRGGRGRGSQRALVPTAIAVAVVGAFVSALVLARENRAEQRVAERLAAVQAPAELAEPPSQLAPASDSTPVSIAAGARDENQAAKAARAVVAAGAAEQAQLVTVRVSTRPSGAKLALVGSGEVCARTPCEVEVISGVPVSFIARHGRLRATTTVAPHAGAQVLLVLDGVAQRAPKAEALELADDLKVPAAFKD